MNLGSSWGVGRTLVVAAILAGGALVSPARAASSADALATAAAADTDGAWLQLAPPCLAGHVAVFDSLRNRVVTYDGRASGEVWVLQLPSGTWSLYAPADTPPPARSDMAAVADVARDRMLIIGGQLDSGGSPGVWALDLSGGMSWAQVACAGAEPTAPRAYSATCDPLRDRVIVLGSGKLWALSLGEAPSWAQLSATGTPKDAGYRTVYDPVRDRLIAFGHNSYVAAYRNVWVLPLAAPLVWSELVASPPMDDLEGTTAIYDPDGDRLLLMGGFDPYLPDEYIYLGWTMGLSLGTTPGWSLATDWSEGIDGRINAIGVYDSRQHRLIVQGGSSATGSLGDTWALDLIGAPTWSPLTSVPPLSRHGHAVAMDTRRSRMMVFGGRRYSMCSSCGWHYCSDLSAHDGVGAWTSLPTPGPSGRAYSSMIYDPVRDRLVVYGGLYEADNGADQLFGEVWSYAFADPPTWSLLVPAGTAPAARYGHTAVYDAANDRMVVFGGTTAAGVTNEVWALDLDGAGEWQALAPLGTAPSARSGHTAIYDPRRARMVMVGASGDSWTLSLSGAPTWVQLTPSGAVRALEWPVGDYDPEHDEFIILADDHVPRALTLGASPAWRDLVLTGVAPGLYRMSMCYDPPMKRMLVFGGGGAYGEFFQDVFAIQLGTPCADVPSSPSAGATIGSAAPNPFRDATRLSFRLSAAGPFDVRLFDLAGREVRAWHESWSPAGERELTWDGRDAGGFAVPAGVYLARIEAGGQRAVRRVVRLR
jgi:hypothetical protein